MIYRQPSFFIPEISKPGHSIFKQRLWQKIKKVPEILLDILLAALFWPVVVLRFAWMIIEEVW